MKSVTVRANLASPPQEVFDFLTVLANHERFLDQMLTDWSFSGPRSGVGAKARARANTPASQDWTEFELVEAEAPVRLVEQGIGAGGKRRTRGTYTLEPAAAGGTKVSFELAWLEASRAERLLPPLTRTFVRRPLKVSMRRLAKELRRR